MFYVPFCDGLTSITLIVLTIEQQIKVGVRQIIDTHESHVITIVYKYMTTVIWFFENS